MIISFFQKLVFTDVTPVMKRFQKRKVSQDDLFSVPFINELIKEEKDLGLNSEENEKLEQNYLKKWRKSPFFFLMKKEKKLFRTMFVIHMTDVFLSLSSVFLGIQILRTFEPAKSGLHLIDFFYVQPTSHQKIIFLVSLALLIFTINVVGASLHAQKLERENFIAWKIPFQVMRSMYIHLLQISKKDRTPIASGEITNMAQNDAQSLGDFFGHCFVDVPVLFASSALVMFVLIKMVGTVAWIGLFILLLQIPISLFSSWLGNILHSELMRRGDKRIDLITEWIQGVRIVRYFGWDRFFQKEIRKATNSEFYQDMKLSAKYSVAFALTVNWWMVVSAGIFGGLLYFKQGYDASIVFGTIWLTGILGLQITPLPWFAAEWSQSLVASKRLRNFFKTKTQREELLPFSKKLGLQETHFIDEILNKNKKDVDISFELKNVSYQFSSEEGDVLKNLNLKIPAGKTLGIVGTVASGKSLLIQVLLGDLIPTTGEVVVTFCDQKSQRCLSLPVHTELGISLLRKLQSYVSQESFIVSGTVSENVPLDYFDHDENLTKSKEINNALYQVSLDFDVKQFSHKEHTVIGEKGVNLSGGQKQRLNLSRSAFLSSQVIYLDDPLSAVDKITGKNLVEKIFSQSWGHSKTIVWSTHRLEYLHVVDHIIYLDRGKVIEAGSHADLISNPQSHFSQLVRAQEKLEGE